MAGSFDPEAARAMVGGYIEAQRITKAEIALETVGGAPSEVQDPLLRVTARGIAKRWAEAGVWRNGHTYVRSVYEDQAGEIDGKGHFARELDPLREGESK